MGFIKWVFIAIVAGFVYVNPLFTNAPPWVQATVAFIGLMLVVAALTGSNRHELPPPELEHESAGSIGWQCQDCQTVMTSNQSECPDCGHTIFDRVRFTNS